MSEVKKRGPGRPPAPDHLKRRSHHFKLAPDISQWLSEQSGSKTELVESALRKTYGIDPQ